MFEITEKELVLQIGSPEDIWDFERADASLHQNDNKFEQFLNGVNDLLLEKTFNGISSMMYIQLVRDIPVLASACSNGGFDAVIINNGGGDVAADNAAIKERVEYLRAQAKLPKGSKVLVWNWPHWLKKRTSFTFDDAKFFVL